MVLPLQLVFWLLSGGSELELAPMNSIEIWLAFNVALALLPLLMTPLFEIFNDVPGTRFNRKQIRDGQLFFFSSSLSATSIGKWVELLMRRLPPPNVFTLVMLIVILLVSALCFGSALSKRIRRELVTRRRPAEVRTLTDGDKAIANTSVAVALLAVVFSFIAFYQGGFR